MEQLIDKISKASWLVKLGVLAAIAVVTTGLKWYLFPPPLHMQIARSDKRRVELEGEFIDKKQIADNLNEYRRRKEELEERLAAALLELPQDKAIDELLRQLNDVGVKAGLALTSVEPGAERREQFYASIPVKMRVSGSYHEIAVFFDSVGKLKRIVNVGDIRFGRPTLHNEKMVLEADFNATTFRFLSKEELAASQAQAKGKGRKR